MRITVQADRVYIDLDEHAPPGPRYTSDRYLGKFGIRTDWNGRGGLLAIEIPVPAGQTLTVDTLAGALP